MLSLRASLLSLSFGLFSLSDYNGCVFRQHGRRLVFSALILALLLILLVSLQPWRLPHLALLRRGDEHAARAERAAAVADYRAAADLVPKDPLPYLCMARVYLDWGRVDEALQALSEAERRIGEGQSTALERLRLVAYEKRADWSAVVEHAQRLLSLVPDDRDARHALARAYVELQQWDAAQAEYGALLRADPADSLALERLGALLIGDDPVAIQYLYAARTDLADRLITALQESGGAAGDPAYSDALLGREFIEAGEWTLAARRFSRALARNPLYPDAHAYLGYAFDQLGLSDEAYPHLARAVELAPTSVVARFFLARHYEQQGDFPAARAEYEAAYDLDPSNAGLCVAIARTWAAEGRYVAAEIWLQEAVSLQPDDPQLWEAMARFYLDHAITAEGRGVAAATRWVQLAPDDAHAHDSMGWAAFQVGDYITARDSLLHAISLDPSLAVAYYHLGLLWTALGKRQEAQFAFARALDLDTTGELAPLIERAAGN